MLDEKISVLKLGENIPLHAHIHIIWMYLSSECRLMIQIMRDKVYNYLLSVLCKKRKGTLK